MTSLESNQTQASAASGHERNDKKSHGKAPEQKLRARKKERRGQGVKGEAARGDAAREGVTIQARNVA
jgi:hypothetical protein